MLSFIQKIQLLDEKARRRWFIILSTTATLFLIAIWAVNLSLILQSEEGENPMVATSSLEEKSSWENFTASIYSATFELKDIVSEKIDTLKTSLDQPHELEVINLD